MVAKTKYGMEIADLTEYFNVLKNKVYKLLPLREEQLAWEKHLDTIMIEVTGLNELIGTQQSLISLLAKLEALRKLETFMAYRKTIFECLNILEEMHEQFRPTES